MLLTPNAFALESPDPDDWQFVEIAPPSGPEVQPYIRYPNLEQRLSHDEKLRLLRQKVKYVFVLFQENRSFDHYFGTFPGANGLFSKPAAATPGFVQKIVNTDGTVGTISPFLIPQTVKDVNGNTVPLYPADTDSVDHSHAGIDNSLDIDANKVALNDRYALNEEKLTTRNGQIVSSSTGLPATSNPTLAQKQKAELVMSHVDCDTIPFLWRYADRFTLFDNFHQTIIGPSTPNAIAMIAGQSGETQWVLHPTEGSNVSASSSNSALANSGGEPVVGDPGPFPGSNLDTASTKPPYNPDDENPATPALNQTYASLPLSFMGRNITQTIATDENPTLDLLDVQNDIKKIASDNLPPVSWGWYQEGYDHEPTDGSNVASHSSYIVHHNGPQYFGYIGDNPAVASNLHGLADFFSDIAAKRLPSGGGVFYVRGGYVITMAWSRSTRTRRCGQTSRAMTIIRATPTPRSRKLCWRTRSTPSPAARTGRTVPLSSPTTRRMVCTTTPIRESAPSIQRERHSRAGRGSRRSSSRRMVASMPSATSMPSTAPSSGSSTSSRASRRSRTCRMRQPPGFSGRPSSGKRISVRRTTRYREWAISSVPSMMPGCWAWSRRSRRVLPRSPRVRSCRCRTMAEKAAKRSSSCPPIMSAAN